MRNFYFTFLIVVALIISACGAKKSYVYKPYNYNASWQYFELTDTIQGTIIIHIPADAVCGFFATASVSIVKTDSDTIRVINLCNVNDIDIGKIVRIYPAQEPPFNVNLPTTSATFERNDTLYDMPTKYDSTILKTTWGTLN